MNFIDNSNVLYAKQFGLRKGHSTSHAIISLIDKVAKGIDNGKIVVGLYLNIKKSFDTVSHSIILDKLYKLGTRGNLLCLI